ncbi:Protein decapping 5 [Ananas comosus]|uniref:Protein decapping 5 n=1 Tax=Ananas comosus TaxID=4615 RepID=A0A199UFE8_ANACO|nr:Protein decapping 5 [Ananas comosus]
MAAEASRSGPSADSYIGSLISLTSKSEIRYEGVLYSINTEESSIGLRNVRSFGTEGRKKDGPQILASDKIFEYILFRGSDIKDLQVKSSPQVQPATSIHNDPAIIQSHYSLPPSTSSTLPSVGAATTPDLSSHTAQVGLQSPAFQTNLPLYQPGGGLGPWASSPASGPGPAMPMMYRPGYYPSSSGLSHLQQPPFLRALPGMSIPQSIQQPLQFPGLNNTSMPSGSENLQVYPPPLLQPSSTSLGLTSSTLSTTSLPTSTSSVLTPEISASSLLDKPALTSTPSASLPFVTSQTTSNVEPGPTLAQIQNLTSLASNKPGSAPGPTLPYQTMPQMASLVASSSSSLVETLLPLVTPGQLLQMASSTIGLPQSSQTNHKEQEAKQVETKNEPLLPEPSVRAAAEISEPILPLPKPVVQKTNGAASYTHHNYRGRGRGRGNGYSRPVTQFTEDFDFIAMNEKFKKDEVWGNLGKSKAQVREKDGELKEDEDYDVEEDDEIEAVKPESKPVYVKDDFFDSLSCATLDRGNRNGRTKFSEQMKIDTETFGDFPRQNRGFRGSGSRGFRGGGRGRGPYYGGRGYGYMGRGRGYSPPNRSSY